MLTIEHCDIEEKIEIGSLFEQIGFHSSTQNTDDSGDSFIPNNWGIEALSLDTYYPIEGYRWTKPEKQIELVVNCDGNKLSLKCSPDHLILARVDIPEGPHGVWKSVKELTRGDKIITKFGRHPVLEIREIEEVERLCDLQVGIAHSYYTNDILSHNSHFLTFLGANALRENVDVLHYTFELSESAVGRRYDSNLCDIDSNFVIENKDKVISQYQDMKLGRLIIKEFPTNTASIYTLRNHIERLNIKGFNPGLIIIDYADIMRSTRQYDSLRHELKLIYEELRGFAGEKAIPLWTASQSNKEGSDSDIVDLSNMSEAYGKAMVADVVISLSRRSHEKSSGHGRLYVAKNRAGKDGIVYPVKIDTSKSKFEITGVVGSFENAVKEGDNDIKKALRTKWRELQNDSVLGSKLQDVANVVDDNSEPKNRSLVQKYDV